jgi:putative oxidoreductase
MFRKLHLLEPYLLSIVRVVVGCIFSMHGMLIFHWISPPHGSMMGSPPPGGHASPGLDLHSLAGFLEVAGGWLFVLGLFTSPVAFILSGEMAFAYFIAHAPQSFWPLFNNGDAAVLYCFFFLLYTLTGPGKWSLDHLIARRRLARFDERLTEV